MWTLTIWHLHYILNIVESRLWDQRWQKLQYEVENLHSTENREPCKESHGASDGADLVAEWYSDVVDNLVMGGGAEVEQDHLQRIESLWYNPQAITT